MPYRTKVLSFALVAIALTVRVGWSQMVVGTKMPGFAQTFGLVPDTKPTTTAQFIESTVPANILWPGEQGSFAFQIANTTDSDIQAKGSVLVIAYGTKGRPGDIWAPDVFKIADGGKTPVDASLKAKGFANLTVKPEIPERFGGYGLVLELEGQPRQFITSVARTFAADPRRVQFPKLGMDLHNPVVLQRLNCKSIRYGWPYTPSTDARFEKRFAEHVAALKALHAANVSVIIEFGGGDFWDASQPMGRPRPHLDENNAMRDTKFDLAWLPSYDADFQGLARRVATDLGWPRGPVVAMKLWNEPWDGISISGWGADMLRYREMYTAMCQGVEEARKQGAQVLLGGCDSSSNTFDKLFPDGSDHFLKWLDFVSIHYQGMFPPATVKAWVDRKHPNGRVRVWDTESWVANCDDRVAAVLAVNMSTGHDRAVGIYGGNISSDPPHHMSRAGILDANGKRKEINVHSAWSTAAAVGAAQHFLGERAFNQLLFRNGLPWVMLFDGNTGDDGRPRPDDGTIVVVGDIGDAFGHNGLLYRTARGFAEIAQKEKLRQELAALPADADAKKRSAIEQAIAKPQALSGASLTLADGGGRFRLHDFYGNPVPASGGKIVVPLDHRGFYLRTDASPGSFAAMTEAVRNGRTEGIEPLAKVCHDLTAPVNRGAVLRLSLTNVLNRPVKGLLTVSLGQLKVAVPTQELTFAEHQTRQIELPVSGDPAASNTYRLSLSFDAGADGLSKHQEDLHVNLIARRTISVDGKLDDWEGVLPQPVAAAGQAGPTLTEAAWFPMLKFDKTISEGVATGFLAYDDQYFYFAAKVADDSPDPGMPRFETLDADDFFYPETSHVEKRAKTNVYPNAPDVGDQPKDLTWPQGVRRYSYRKRPELPAGNSNDNVQIAFNVIPPDAKTWYPSPPGTMPGYIGYRDTDYEYALNPVAERYGGGVEVWRLRHPDLPHKHYYPRQPKAPGEGPVKDARLSITRDGTTRIVEAAIPWSEIPLVKKQLDGGQTVKFSFRINNNKGAGMELSRLRSVAKVNGSFLADWVEHWANELEFAFER